MALSLAAARPRLASRTVLWTGPKHPAFDIIFIDPAKAAGEEPD